MSNYKYLLDIALILLTTKAFSLLTKRMHMPQVVGALIAGLAFGPAVLNVLHGTEFLSQVAEIGVIVIMFTAGLETNITQLRQTGKTGFIVALIGVIVPLILGTLFGFVFNKSDPGGQSMLAQNIFIGVVLTATSVSITVETLKELGRLNTQVGNTILAAAIIDDVLGLICLALITSVGGENASGEGIGIVLLKVVFFIVFTVIVCLGTNKLMVWYSGKVKNAHMRRFPVMAFVFCLFMSYTAEHFFGVANIIGAFAAGLAIGNTSQASYIESRFQPMSYLLLTPIFFANVGINITFGGMNATLVIATIVLIAVALLSKLVGCGLGAKVCGMTTRQSMQVGLGMFCRGEVALIVANKGQAMGLMPADLFGPIVFMVVLTAIFTPILLKLAFRSEVENEGLQTSNLVDRHEVIAQMDEVNRHLLDMDSSLKQSSIQQHIPQHYHKKKH